MSHKLTTLFFLLCAWTVQLAAAPIIGLNHPDRIADQYIVVLKADMQQKRHYDEDYEEGKHKHKHPPKHKNKHKGKHAEKHNNPSRNTPDALPNVDMAEQIASRYQGTVRRKFSQSFDGFVINISDPNLRDLANDNRIDYIEADRIISIQADQTPAPWNLDRIDQRDLSLDNMYTYNTPANNVNAYIIDSGIRITHNEFNGRAQLAFSAVNDGRGARDCNGHGTHVAGTVGGTTYGVAKQVDLYSVRVLDCQGNGFLSGVIAGIDWVTSNHNNPAVANMSLGGTASRSLDTAVANAVASGVTFVVAAGNDNANACNYSPARVASAITVGASTPNDTRASFSNWGSCLDLFAPGVDVISAWYVSDSATRTLSGTSMATPHVTGVAALYLAEHPDATPAEVTDTIISTATTGRLTAIGNGSPNRLVFSLLNASTTPGQPPATCPAGYEVYSGNLAYSGDSDFQPNGNYYFSFGGTQNGLLIGPDGGNFDLYLWRWNGFWQAVRSSTSPDSQESITHNGFPGYYVWRILSASGNGNYLFCLQRP